MKPIIIMGPTASGKTDLALKIAALTDGEIISADSRQIYTDLSAGTAKPEGSWRILNNEKVYISCGFPYHLVDFLDPKVSYDTGRFVKDTEKIFKKITGKGKTPVFAGGTGMYIQAFWNGIDPLPPADQSIRTKLSETASRIGRVGLHCRLQDVDPEAAQSIPPNNIQRVIRALEVHELTGTPISKLWTRRFHGTLPTHKAVFAVIEWNRALLHERIKSRTNSIFEEWVSETRQLLKKGYPEDCPALKSLGYPQIIDYICGRITKSAAIHEITTLTNAYAKRQTTWFRQYKNAMHLAINSEKDWQPDLLCERMLMDTLH